jgi:hypothetical protein
MMAFIAIAIDGTLLEMPAMCEITDGERIPCPLIKCQRYRLAGVARSASREFLPRLMSMTGITLWMRGKTRLNQPCIELMAFVALGHGGSSRHFGGVQVLFVRKLFQAKLHQLTWKGSHLGLCLERKLMADNTKPVIGRSVVRCMARKA